MTGIKREKGKMLNISHVSVATRSDLINIKDYSRYTQVKENSMHRYIYIDAYILLINFSLMSFTRITCNML